MGMVVSLVTPLATDGLDWEWEVATHSRPGHGACSSSSPIPGVLGIHWRSLRVASFMPFDIPAAASVKETVAALARQRFIDDGVDRVGRRAGGTNQLANDQGDGAAYQQQHEQGRIGHHFTGALYRCTCVFWMPATPGGDGISCNCSSLTWPYQGPWPGLIGVSELAPSMTPTLFWWTVCSTRSFAGARASPLVGQLLWNDGLFCGDVRSQTLAPRSPVNQITHHFNDFPPLDTQPQLPYGYQS